MKTLNDIGKLLLFGAGAVILYQYAGLVVMYAVILVAWGWR